MQYLRYIHSSTYLDDVVNNIAALTIDKNDLYYCKETANCAFRSVGCLLNLVDHIMKGESNSGIAIIRPPGHHADHDSANGFCYVNNIAMAATHLLMKYKLKK